MRMWPAALVLALAASGCAGPHLVPSPDPDDSPAATEVGCGSYHFDGHRIRDTCTPGRAELISPWRDLHAWVDRQLTLRQIREGGTP